MHKGWYIINLHQYIRYPFVHVTLYTKEPHVTHEIYEGVDGSRVGWVAYGLHHDFSLWLNNF